MVTDGVITFIGQSPQYWQNHTIINEGGLAYFLLAGGPVVYIGGSLLYFLLCYWLVSWLKQPLNIMLAIALTIGHSWGSSTWLIQLFYSWTGSSGSIGTRPLLLLPWVLLIAYFVLISICVGAALTQYIRNQQQKIVGSV
jgi:hypothetical protein